MEFKKHKHKEVEELINFFDKETIEFCVKNRLYITGSCEKILNIPAFIENHLETIKKHYPNPIYMPEFKRLCFYRDMVNELRKKDTTR